MNIIKKQIGWIAGLALIVGVTMLVDRSGTVRAIAFREPFFKGKPASYWKDVLRTEGELGKITEETTDLLGASQALPVLKHCLKDDDPNVRWPATRLLHGVFEWHKVEPILRDLLENDPDPEVKYSALLVFAQMSRNSKDSTPQIAKVAKDDSDAILQTAAHSALWIINENAAFKAGDWQKFHSEEFGFSVMLPGQPVHRVETNANEFGEIETHIYESMLGAAHFTASVALLPDEIRQHYSEADRYDSMAGGYAELLGAKILEDERVQIGEHTGHQVTMDAGAFTQSNRMVIIGDRGYSVSLTLPNQWLGGGAVQFCLDSFTVE